MKRLNKLLVFLLTLLSFSTYSQEAELSRVKKINGVEAYVMCEPLRDYEVVANVGTGIKAESIVTGGLINKSISDRVTQFINRVKKEYGEVDAIVYTGGKKVVGIKFKDEGNDKNKQVGRVQRAKGRPLFVMSEPLKNYRISKSKGGGIKWKSAVTAGLINNSIEEDVMKIVDKLEKKPGDAYYFDGTKEGSLIFFN